MGGPGFENTLEALIVAQCDDEVKVLEGLKKILHASAAQITNDPVSNMQRSKPESTSAQIAIRDLGEYTLATRTSNNGGMIMRMKQVYRMYKLVKWVDEDIKRHDKETPEAALENAFYAVTPKGIMENYSVVSGKTNAEIRDLIKDCLDSHYLTERKRDRFVYVGSGRGRFLLDKLWIFPVGLWNAFFEKYGNLASFLLGLVGSAALLGLWTLVKIIWSLAKSYLGW